MKKPVIVCIDDEPDVLQSLKIELKKAIGDRCIIETAEGGEDALELLADLQADEHEIALVVSDYIMPDIKGDELLRQFHEQSPDTLTIMLSGQADLEALSNSIKYAKLYRYIPKPWQKEDLELTVVEAVHSYLQDQKLISETQKRQQANEELTRVNQELTRVNQELTRVNEEVSANESRLNQFLGALPVGVSVYNPDGSIAYLNHAAQELIGTETFLAQTAAQLPVTAQAYQGDSDELYFPENFPIMRALRGEFVKVDGVEISQYGLIISLEITASPIYDRSGNVAYAIAAIQDISERKEAETVLTNYRRTLETQIVERTEQLQQAVLAAESANRAKSTFLANMSHELRTPLNAILGFAQIIESDSDLAGENVENIKIIHRSGEHLLTLIDQALDLSKIEAGRMTLDVTNFDLYRLLDELEEMFQMRLQNQQVELLFQRNPDVPQYVQTDAVKLRQVLLNLLSNAIKFTPTGRVSVRVSHSSEAATVSLSDDGTSCDRILQFEIEDTGVGIAPEELENVFQAFMQTSSGQKAQKGTGLGLTISRQFVRLMGGDITVESQVERGTIFKFEIQVNVVDVSAIPAAKTERQVMGLEPNQPEYRILIADDREESRLLLVKMLSPMGLELQQACNGREAIEIWENWQPHLIFMDLRMPVMDGYEATREIRAIIQQREQERGRNEEITNPNPEFPISKIIALTASIIEMERRSFAFFVGCDDFICKPFRKQDIFNTLNKHLGVKYIYSSSTESASSGESLSVSDSASNVALANASQLPAEWTQKMKQVIRSADFDLIASTIEEIKSENPEFAQILEGYLNNFDYPKILELISDA